MWSLTRAEEKGRITSSDLMTTFLLSGLHWASCQQHLQIILLRVTANPFSTQPVFILGIALIQVQSLAPGLVELHKVCTVPQALKLSRSLWMASHSFSMEHPTELSFVSNLAEGALNPTVHVASDDVKQH